MFPVYLNDAENMSSSNFTISALSCEILNFQSSADEDESFVRYYAVWTGKRLPMFRRNVFVSVLKVEQSKKRVTSVTIYQSIRHITSKHFHRLKRSVVGRAVKYASQPSDCVTDCTTDSSGDRMKKET
jgi:hypothetical protein